MATTGCGLLAFLALACGAPAWAADERAKQAVPPFAAGFGAWQVHCDQCVSYEEPICTLSSRTETAWLLLYPVETERAASPPLAMELLPGRLLSFETEGTLTVFIDGDVAARIAPPDVTWQAMTDGLYVESPATMALLPDLRAGDGLVLRFADRDGTSDDAFSLDGFAPALDAMMAQLPIARPRPEDWAAFGCEP